MDKEKKTEEMAKATGACEHPLRSCSDCWEREENECSCYSHAKSLQEASYGDVKQAVKEFARKFKHKVLEKQIEDGYWDKKSICWEIDATANELLKEYNNGK